jgi:hypothetical protein
VEPGPEVFQLAPNVRFRRVDDEGLILRQDTAEVIVVNQVAARLLQLLDGSMTLHAVLATLSQEFDATPDRLAGDVKPFINDLLDAGFLRAVHGDGLTETGA